MNSNSTVVAVEATNEITYYEPKIESPSNFTFDIDETSGHYDEESIKLKNIIGSKESEFVKELSSKIITTEEEIEEECSEEEEENPYISVTSFEYQQSQETIQTTLEFEQSSGPFKLCYEEIYDCKGFIKIDEKTFMLIIKLYEFLENNINIMLSSAFTTILPRKLEKLFNYFENFEKVFIENFKWDGQSFYGSIDIKELINQLDNGLGIKQTNYVRINSFGRIFQTSKSPLQPYSPLRPKKISYDVDYCLEDTLRHTVMDVNVEQETKDFLNSLAKESEDEDQYDKNHQEVIETNTDTYGNPCPLNATRKNSFTNNLFNGSETDSSIEESDGNVSEFSFEELNEGSDIESVTTTDTEWRLV